MNNKKYWKSLGELNNNDEFIKQSKNEFTEQLPIGNFLGKESLADTKTPRRDFLKFLGFSVTAASLAACETPVRKTVPYLIKPEEITVGIANWYASTYDDGNDFCNILVKTREGRPIKIEGNKLSSFSGGGTNARVQASVLSLYDNERLQGPLKDGKATDWKQIDSDLIAKLEAANAAGNGIRILSSTITSPSLNALIAEFTAKYPTTKLVTYDAISYAGIRKANQKTFGAAVIPTYNFSNANVIVSFGADFLGNWVSPIQFARQYGKSRKLSKDKKEMSKHFQFESILSLSGANADVRVGVKPSQIGAGVVNLYNAIATKAGAATLSAGKVPFDKSIAKAADALWANQGKSIVICGSNDSHIQTVVNGINYLLHNYDKTIDIVNHLNLGKGDDAEFSTLIDEMKGGKVGVLMMHNCNPVYTSPKALEFEAALAKVGTSVSFNISKDETADKCKYVCPNHHYLESWGDASPQVNSFALIQPTIYPLFNTRAIGESLLAWMKGSGNYQDYIKSVWQKSMFTMQNTEPFFENFWEKCLHDGIFETSPRLAEPLAWSYDLTADAADVANEKGSELEITFYQKMGIGNGNQANNPWLQEMPDPISKTTWDNYITMSPKEMERRGYNIIHEKEEKMSTVNLTVNGVTFQNVPVFPQPGQPEGTIGLALGYGRTKAGKVANNIGVNAYSYMGKNADGLLSYYATKVSIADSAEKYMIVTTQTHQTLMGRNMVKETTFSEYLKDPKAGNETVMLSLANGHEHKKVPAHTVDLWATEDKPGFARPGLQWSMGIDLNVCIGCGNCVVACQSENNVAVVGKDEVRMNREMHWIRIDRYYSSSMTKEKGELENKGIIETYHEMEVPEENPQVVFQPLMCMHCNHAPCETVCPVIATTHSNEGLNHMTYNRCVGTKYCANNCPYKVRRFNWFKYFENKQFDFNMNNDLGKMVLNPDVTVRSRGVMEKCSMCIQRIQEGKLTAKKEGREIRDGEFETACAQSCPTNAITFGNIADSNSKVAKMKEDERSYYMLEELGVKPSVFYQVKVRNIEESLS
ncbi:MAG: TAT-variant-translocated molybdopterin oxidoreductase [Bacteroidia bacterium]|nr:TAT-variant-translocated molybdopterin oxidoreductase [Bacteroidia bacterium]MCZ2248167.1 TAT-variant-translocated molybdopterin oxidoreductase [Bacteroidia bacterium]